MNYAKITSELEEEYSWRFNELIFFKNRIAYIDKEDDKNIYRKALIVMLYSHFEGYSKYLFEYYISAINKEKYKRKDLIPSLIALSMDPVFCAYDNHDKKCIEFHASLPEDTKLHKYARQKDFISEFHDFLEKVAEIPEAIADTESNLKPKILKKILFRLGFDISLADKYASTINKLLNYRNNIAHGSKISGINNGEYGDIEENVIEVMESLKDLIAITLKNEKFLVKNIAT